MVQDVANDRIIKCIQHVYKRRERMGRIEKSTSCEGGENTWMMSAGPLSTSVQPLC